MSRYVPATSPGRCLAGGDPLCLVGFRLVSDAGPGGGWSHFITKCRLYVMVMMMIRSGVQVLDVHVQAIACFLPFVFTISCGKPWGNCAFTIMRQTATPAKKHASDIPVPALEVR